MVMRCTLFLLLLCSCRLSYTSETGHESEPDVQNVGASIEPGGCVFTEEELVAAINASTDGALTEAVVNCFAYQNVDRSLYNAIVSGMDASLNGMRYVVECAHDLLFLTPSLEPFTNLTAYCAQCQDNNTTNLCVPGQECASNCTACFGVTQSECLACETARFENQCVSECPPFSSRTPNSENGNECECRNYFSGTNCTECDLVCNGEDSHYFLDLDNCICVANCSDSMYIELLDYEATVPEEVIGSPNAEEESEITGGVTGHERKRRAWHKMFRRAEESTHGEQEFVPEPGICVSRCSIDTYKADANSVCYACRHTFCIECNVTTGACLQCRDGTLLNSSASNDDEFCLGFYTYIEELTEELEHEEEEELAKFEQEQQDLIIYIPIACGVAFIFFLSMAIFAHFRYPHLGEKKRHRKPPKEETTNISEFERSLRPQTSVRYR